jgi:mannose-6-phosphate isomerase-like protein (cupin superfamily)
MMIKDARSIPEITAADLTPIRELLSPMREQVMTHYSVALARLPGGTKSLPHRLRSSSEVYIIIQGAGIMHIEDEAAPASAGQLVYIPPGALQYIESTGADDLVFYCIVDPPWRAQDESVVV